MYDEIIEMYKKMKTDTALLVEPKVTFQCGDFPKKITYNVDFWGQYTKIQAIVCFSPR